MLRSILIVLGATPDGESALELGLSWARRQDALISARVVVDEPGIRVSEATLFSEGYTSPASPMLLDEVHTRAEALLDQVRRRCAEAGVRHRVALELGIPHARILDAAHTADTVLLGRHERFSYGRRADDEATFQKVMMESPRPIVSVPRELSRAADGPVLIAFDGSSRSSRALFDFAMTGLGRGRSVHVVSIDRDPEVAARLAERAVAYLTMHELRAVAHPLDGEFPPVPAILGAIEQVEASLLVIGAFGHNSPLRELFVGSATRTMFAEVEIPVFCSH